MRATSCCGSGRSTTWTHDARAQSAYRSCCCAGAIIISGRNTWNTSPTATVERRQVDLRLNLKPNVPEVALKPYRVGDITVRLTNIKPGPADTFRLQNVRVIAQRPMKIRPNTLPDALARTRPALHRGRSEPRADRPQQTGHFSAAGQSGRHAARLAAGGADTLDVVIDAQFDYPLEAARWRPT